MNMTNGKILIVEYLCDMAETLVEAGRCIGTLVSESNYVQALELITDMDGVMTQMLEALATLDNENEDLERKKVTISILEHQNVGTFQGCLNYFRITVQSTQYSLDTVKCMIRARSLMLPNKIQFELNPFLECVHESADKMLKTFSRVLLKGERRKVAYSNLYIENGKETGNYKYELSVVILAYNKLKYTKLCVESVLKYMPVDVNYELILVNHGSTDGTKEYFEGVNPTKQLNILVNGAAAGLVSKIYEGKYLLWISNDVIITQNAVMNMLSCVRSDKNIGFVVPTTPNISNLQTIPGEYEDLDTMYDFATKNNKCDPYRWEQRFRLCNPLYMGPTHYTYSDHVEKIWGDPRRTHLFPDDLHSWAMRRSGYKNILVKDAYCYHFGSITVKDEIDHTKEMEFYNDGRKLFREVTGIDPWGLGHCFDLELCNALHCYNEEAVDILAVNCGYGSTPLRIKEMIKENVHNLNVRICAMTDWKEAIDDATILSDEFEYVVSENAICKKLANRTFDYIIKESEFVGKKNSLQNIDKLHKFLKPQGSLAIKTADRILKDQITGRYYGNTILLENWIVIHANIE